MALANFLCKSKCLWPYWVSTTNLVNFKTKALFVRSFSRKSDDGCRKAIVDMPPEKDPVCPTPCKRRTKKEGILHKIKMRVIEGGTNFGTPFRRLQGKEPISKVVDVVVPEQKALPAPKKKALPMPQPRAGVQVSVLGADTGIGQYVALLLKQCPCIKKLRLYDSRDITTGPGCCRHLCQVVEDLQHINTNCLVQAFGGSCCELERCLQNTDIVLMLENGYLNVDMPFDKRFCYQAPIVKRYADCIATECPKAFVIVCASPIDCMVPLIAETLKETGWYDPRKIMGSLAVPEMRASTLAARALCLEPRYTRVPCVGGTEGDALVPLFSKAVEYFDFAKHNALLMTDAVRAAPVAVARSDGLCLRAADLSEAHALSGLVTKVAHALLCHDIPRVTGFVETDAGQVISPARYLAIDVLLNNRGIFKKFDFPAKLSCIEKELLDLAFIHISESVSLSQCWYQDLMNEECERCRMQMRTHWCDARHYDHLDDCAIQLT